ncbi:MAG TPA: PaaI family thioesterase [Candidatus Limnocylindria bacterium]|nr:PaaI family thioesterase [Candidatus Limnocylindria bacterium]
MSDDTSAAYEALGRLAAAVRALAATTVQLADTAAASEAAAEIERLVARLVPRLAEPPLPRHPSSMSQPGAPADLMPFDVVVGRLNPLAPPIVFSAEDGKSVGRVTFTRPYEGPPGCVHGGVIAAAFDQTLSIANILAGAAGPTKQLVLRYRKPTPLGVPVRFEGWQTRVEGRSIHAAGRLLAGDVVTAEAEGVFVQLAGRRVLRMLEPDDPEA